jgi:secondary thiamine-phosphate synthase enzyme
VPARDAFFTVPEGTAMQKILTIRTAGPGLYEFTEDVTRFVRDCGVDQGLLTLFVQHTSCSLCVQENADPDVRRDLDEFFRRLVPSADAPSMHWVAHTTEGPDDMPAHIKAALTPVSLSIPVTAGRPALGQWQGIYLFEHRDRGHTRRVIAHVSA